jgi:hypothetical protein
MAPVNGGTGDGGHLCRRRRPLLMAAMVVFVDGNGKG